MKNNLYQTLQYLKKTAITRLKECYIGSSWDVDKKSHQYPLMVLDYMANDHVYKPGSVELNIDVYLVDLVNEKTDDSYKQQLHSDLLHLATDYVSYLSENDNNLYRMKKRVDKTITFFKEKWADEVCGVRMRIVLDVFDDNNTCENIFIN
ncbi:MAG: hypothetical protein KC589_03940 [Nanoarchaeota archaeon]|nr:hypothetical protein [Nanoarchaeota archaeon]